VTVKKDGDYAITRESLYGITNEPTYAGATSFMRRKYTRDLTGVDLVVSGVPLDTATTNRPGARFGPRGIRAASANISWMRPYNTTVDPFEKLAVIDYGDCFFDFGLPETVPDTIEAHASSIIDAGPALLSLGGDHFIAWPLIKAHAKKYGKPLSLLHFDAHSDTWEDEGGRVDHGTMFWHAAKEGLVDPAHSVQIGLRTTNDDTLGFNILDGPWGRADDPSGHPDHQGSHRHKPDRHGHRRGSAGLRCRRNYVSGRRHARRGNDQHLRAPPHRIKKGRTAISRKLRFDPIFLNRRVAVVPIRHGLIGMPDAA
jgi:hypothetical protein